jgi:hypothetical protein
MADFERCPIGTKRFLQDSAKRFREYENSHQQRVNNAVALELNGAPHAEKAARNREMADRAEALLRDF